MKKIIFCLGIAIFSGTVYCTLNTDLQQLTTKLNTLFQGLSKGPQSTITIEQKQLNDLIAEFTKDKRDTKNIESYINIAKQYFESEDPEKNQVYFYWYARLLLERFDKNYSNLKLSELANKIKTDPYFKQSLTKLVFQLGNLINDIKKIRAGIEQKLNPTQKQGLSDVIATIEDWIKNQTEVSKTIREEKEEILKKKIELYALLDTFSQEGKKFVGFNKLRSIETAKILKKYEEVFQELTLAGYGTQKEIDEWNEGLEKLKATFEELEKQKEKEKSPEEKSKETKRISPELLKKQKEEIENQIDNANSIFPAESIPWDETFFRVIGNSLLDQHEDYKIAGGVETEKMKKFVKTANEAKQKLSEVD